MRGSVRLSEVLEVATDGAKSPAEANLYTLFSVPRRRGGFGIPGIQLNLRINLDGIARMNLDLQGIRPDLYEPEGNTAMEYQSDPHLWCGRERDDRRSDALEAVGIRTFQVNKVRAKSLCDLSGIAAVFAKRAGIRRNPPSEDLLYKRLVLHGRLFYSGSHVKCDQDFLMRLSTAAAARFFPI